MNILYANALDFYKVEIVIDDLKSFYLNGFIIKNGDKILQAAKYDIIKNSIIIYLTEPINIKLKAYVNYQDFSREIYYYRLYSTEDFNIKYFTHKPLGAAYSKTKTSFHLWSPICTKASVLLYKNGEPLDDEYIREIPMQEDAGYFSAEVKENIEGYFYTFKLNIYNSENETIDPYAKAISINGIRGAIIDFLKTEPLDFKKSNTSIEYDKSKAIIYEISIRDFSKNDSSGIKNKMKFLGLTELNTKNNSCLSTGLSHLKELGITHVQLMPAFHFAKESTDEKDGSKYNWGYDPQDFNALEGVYSTNPYDPCTRIREFKEMISCLHKNNIGVIMDVVYNHVFKVHKNNLNFTFPGYYFRYNPDGSLVNGSGCSNDFSSEKSMARRFIIDSLTFLMEEYCLDGFRFDLMGLLDITTMNKINHCLSSINPNVIIYGEGWNLNTTLSEDEKANIKNSSKMPGISHFNDKIRDLITGGVFLTSNKGIVTGYNFNNSLAFYCLCGCCIKEKELLPIFDSPLQSLNYCCSHDNHIIRDRLQLSSPNASIDEIKIMNKLSCALVLLSQGISFLHCGEEFLRTKNGCENSFNAGDIVNSVDWNLKKDNYDLFLYYKGLIEIKKAYPHFSLKAKEDVIKRIVKLENTPDDTIGIIIKGTDFILEPCDLYLLFNFNKNITSITVKEGTFGVLANNVLALKEPFEIKSAPTIEVEPLSLLLLKKF